MIDSSVWIDFFRAKAGTHTECLKQLIADGEDLCICGHIFAEVLRGTRHDEQYQKIERRFAVLEFLPMTAQTFQASADLYRSLRKSGVTMKNTVDTFIAAVAVEHDVYLLHNDSDFTLIAGVYPLKVYLKP
ncbi:MAG: PIN domain-containing protein [Verrucomicrobiota bacterium]